MLSILVSAQRILIKLNGYVEIVPRANIGYTPDTGVFIFFICLFTWMLTERWIRNAAE